MRLSTLVLFSVSSSHTHLLSNHFLTFIWYDTFRELLVPSFLVGAKLWVVPPLSVVSCNGGNEPRRREERQVFFIFPSSS
jgi:hypothetical protein